MISKALCLAAASLFGASLIGVSAQAAPSGQQLFLDNCSACHRPNGQGVKGAFPSLVADPIATGEAKAAALKVLNGRGGMPAFKASLPDETIAAVLTYVRSSWGNKAGPVTTAIVAAARGAGAGRQVQSGQQAH
ncbi:MAG TPA: c-type cytochrome [Caulobacteraceae bacterium]